MDWIDYKQIRHEVITGDLFFETSNSLISRIIRFVTKGNVSHVGMFVKLGNRIFTVECKEGKGCVMTLASVRLHKIIFIKTNSHIHIDNILKDINKIPYSYVAAIFSPFIKTKSSMEYCSKWVAQKLHLKCGKFPIDILRYLGYNTRINN